MFRVEWLEVALDELTSIWLHCDSADRERVTAASNEADRALQADPHGSGESRPFGQRIVFALPLSVLFQVEPDDQTVTIVQVRFVARPKR